MRKIGAFLGLALAAACTSSGAAGGGKIIWQSTEEASGQMEGTADASTAGRVLRVKNGVIVLNPYDSATTMEFALKRESPIFADSEDQAKAALRPGSDVRVFYREKGTKTPEVVGLEVLSADSAKEAQEHGAMPPEGSAEPRDHYPSDEEPGAQPMTE